MRTSVARTPTMTPIAISLSLPAVTPGYRIFVATTSRSSLRAQQTGAKWVRGGAVFAPPNEVVFTFGGSYVCASFGENRSRNATVRVRTDGHTH